MKKNLLVVSSLALAAVMLASCGDNKTNNVNGSEKVSFKEMYTTSAVSGINMLNTKSLKAKKNLSDEDKNKILDNINYIDEFLSDNAIQSEEKETSEEEKALYGDFAKTYDLTVNFGTHNEVYKFYYNETVKKDLDDEIKDKMNEEVESHLKGIVVYNAGTDLEKKYEMIGDKEIEIEDGEKEFEVQFKITDLESKAKVIVKQEIEEEDNENEVEYSYREFDENGKLVDSFNLEIEKEGNETEYVVFRPTDKVRYGYKVVVKDDKTFVDVKIREGKEVLTARLVKTESGYEFVE